MKDFFVSYTGVDKSWAEWIAWALEDAGHSIVVQAWDFHAGSNFVLDMQQALREAQRVIAVLSPAYIKSEFGGAEWAATFAEDPTGIARKLVPVRVEHCEPVGLLRTIVRIDLVSLDENTARQVLLEGLSGQRKKPRTAPAFPSKPPSQTHHPAFPAAASVPQQAPSSAPFIPQLRPRMTDLDTQKFMRKSFDEIQRYFQHGLSALENSSSRFETQLQQISPSKFIAEIYVDGKLRRRAKLWVGSVMSFGRGLQIGYVEGNGFSVEQDNVTNEVLVATEGRSQILLKALMHAAASIGRSDSAQQLNPEQLTGEHAAAYLWLRFVAWIDR